MGARKPIDPAIFVDCPVCGAGPLASCTIGRAETKDPHLGRRQVAREVEASVV